MSKVKKKEPAVTPGFYTHDDLEERISSDEDSRTVSKALLDGPPADEIADKNEYVDEP